MALDERLAYLLLGCAIGFVLGYLSKTLKQLKNESADVVECVHGIKEEVHEIDTLIKKRRERDEGGFMRIPLAADVLMVFVLALCLWASYSTGATNNKLEAAVSDIKTVQAEQVIQDKRIEKITQCTLEYTSKTIKALNERTTYSQDQADSNVKVLKAQAQFLKIILVIPPVGDGVVRSALQDYVDKLRAFDDVAAKNRAKVTANPFPTNENLANCLGVALPDVETGEDAGASSG